MHKARDHPEDRKHFGAELRISMSLERLVEQCDGGWESEYLNVYLVQNQGQDVPQINLSKGGMPGVMLTLAEARDLARALTAVIDEATAVKS